MSQQDDPQQQQQSAQPFHPGMPSQPGLLSQSRLLSQPGLQPQQALQSQPMQYPQHVQQALSQVRSGQVQEVRFYKSPWLFFGSAVGRFQRDCQRMLGQGWHLRHFGYCGLDSRLRRVIVAIYER